MGSQPTGFFLAHILKRQLCGTAALGCGAAQSQHRRGRCCHSQIPRLKPNRRPGKFLRRIWSPTAERTRSSELRFVAADAAAFFHTAAFQVAPQFTLGNSSRNPVRGPAYRDGDLSFSKHTRIGERLDAEFRPEVFNLTNTPAFEQPAEPSERQPSVPLPVRVRPASIPVRDQTELLIFSKICR